MIYLLWFVSALWVSQTLDSLSTAVFLTTTILFVTEARRVDSSEEEAT